MLAEMNDLVQTKGKSRVCKEMLRAGALFAGVGGFVFGLGRAGFKTVWANEVIVT